MLIRKVIELFRKQGIKYAIAGGYAVSLHGAVRGTVDIDFVVSVDEETLTKIESCMKSLGLVSRVPVTAKSVAQFRREYVEDKNMKVWSFSDPNWPQNVVDIMILYDIADFQIEKRRTVFGEVNIISISDLIAMKKVAGRPQDLSDIKALEAIQKDRKK